MSTKFRCMGLLLFFFGWGTVSAEGVKPDPLKVFLGIVSRYEPRPEGGREIVKEVASGGPAARAGLRVGDHILGIGGRPHRAASLSALLDSLGWIKAGEPVQLDVLRDGKRMTLELTPEASPPGRQAALRRFLDECRDTGGCNELCSSEEPIAEEVSLRSFVAAHGQVEMTFTKDPRTQEPILARSQPELPAGWDFRSDPIFRDGPMLGSIRNLLGSRAEVKAIYAQKEPGRFSLELKP